MEIKLNLETILKAGIKVIFGNLNSPTYHILIRKPNGKGSYTDLERIDLGKLPQLEIICFDKD